MHILKYYFLTLIKKNSKTDRPLIKNIKFHQENSSLESKNKIAKRKKEKKKDCLKASLTTLKASFCLKATNLIIKPRSEAEPKRAKK